MSICDEATGEGRPRGGRDVTRFRAVPEAVIIEAVRTPMGALPGRAFALRPDDLAAHVVAAAVERSGIDPAEVTDFMWAPPTSPARTTATSPAWRPCSPGLPVEVPGVDGQPPLRLRPGGRQPGGSRSVELGEGDVYLAGGVESMSRAPWVMPKPERGLARGEQTLHDTTLGWRMVNPRMAERYSTEAMGETAENVAERYGISREDQDAFALRSHERAVAARERRAARRGDRARSRHRRSARGGDPVTVADGRGAARRRHAREARRAAAGLPRGRQRHRRQRLDAQRRRRLPGADERREGCASSAASPLARIVSFGVAGVDPAVMGIGPIPAIGRGPRRGRARESTTST